MNASTEVPQNQQERESEKFRVIEENHWRDGRVTYSVIGEGLTREEAGKIDHGANDYPDDSRVFTTTRVEEMSKIRQEQDKAFRVVREDHWNDGAVTYSVIGENLTRAEADRMNSGANDYPDDSRSSTTTRLEEMPTYYDVALLDPRPNADNSKIFEGKMVYGIEVTVPSLAARCELGNLDPQHSGGDSTRAAIEDAVSAELPPNDARLVTIRPDLDALGTMAVFNIRRKSELPERVLAKVKDIAELDTFSKGAWPGEKQMPSKENPWPEGRSELSPLVLLAMDFKVPLATRVEKIQQWLELDIVPKEYAERLESEREEVIKALETGAIRVNVRDGVALVESAHRSGTDIGYRKAPVVVVYNPKFRLQGGEPHAKYTISQYTTGYVDLKAVFEELASKEVGWGGSPTIGGSPQGVSSGLSMDEVFDIVQKHKKST